MNDQWYKHLIGARTIKTRIANWRVPFVWH